MVVVVMMTIKLILFNTPINSLPTKVVSKHISCPFQLFFGRGFFTDCLSLVSFINACALFLRFSTSPRINVVFLSLSILIWFSLNAQKKRIGKWYERDDFFNFGCMYVNDNKRLLLGKTDVRFNMTNKEDDSFGEGERNQKSQIGSFAGEEPQDADYLIPSLNDELEALILARVPRSFYWKVSLVNKRFLTLFKSGELFKIRREIGFKEATIYMLASGESNWWAFDPQFQACRKLPVLPSDSCFPMGDKESLCAGTHLIVSGREICGAAVWRYELIENKWCRGPSMINPRCLFASASCGACAMVAGGIDMECVIPVGKEFGQTVLNTAEKYNPESKLWESLPSMHVKRKLCSGCYMDKKFYVIGGRDDEGNDLASGEAFDEEKNQWELIPNMLEDLPVATSQSPPLVAVVNNELYSLEASSNELKVYLKRSNAWKKLGPVPVRADFNRGWGVAFKSLGSELLVIGASSGSDAGHCTSMAIYTCVPNKDADELLWTRLECRTKQLSHFILNCSVMMA